MGCESSDVVKFNFGSLFQGHMEISKLKSAYNLFVIVPRLLGCETNLSVTKGRDSSGVIRFNL